MICNWCQKSTAEECPVPGKDGAVQMVCRSCADRARSVARSTLFLATAPMPAPGGAAQQGDRVAQDGPSKLN